VYIRQRGVIITATIITVTAPFARDVTEPAKIRIGRIRMLDFKSVGFGCGFVTRSQLKYAFDCQVHSE